MDYEYDQRNNRTLERLKINESKYKITRFYYDEANRLIKKNLYINNDDMCPDEKGQGTSIDAVTEYSYDGNGNVTQIITPERYKIIREYDRVDRLIKETKIEEGFGERVTTAEYDSAGNQIKTTDVNGNSELREFDVLNRPIKITDKENNI